MDREAMQMALEALVEINKLSIGENAICLPAEIDGAMDALRQALETEQEPVGDDRVMTVVYRNVQKEDAQSFMDHPKAVWFGWCHAPYERDDARFKLEKAITSPPASKPWVGLTAYEIQEIHSGNQHWGNFACAIEAKLREKNKW